MSTKSKSVQSTESVRIHTESFGQPSKMAYVCIAGAMASGRFWTDEFCRALSSPGCTGEVQNTNAVICRRRINHPGRGEGL